MDNNQLTYVLNIFAQYRRCFTLEELSHFADSDSDIEMLGHAFLSDSRFLQPEEADSSERYFISKASLFQWFCRLSIKLAQAKQARLSKHQVAILMDSLRIDGRWDSPPTEAIQFGSHFGFIGSAWTTNQYVFPLAHVLSFTESPSQVASIVMENFPRGEVIHLAFEQLAQQLIRDGFSKFSEKVRYVVQAREGFLTSKRMTLQQIGTQLGGITRERARQLEEKFWTNLQARPRGRSLTGLFSTALVCNVISNQGSLVVHQSSPEAFLLSFLARCTGAPQAIFPDTQLVILGASQKDLVSHNKAACLFQQEADIDSLYRKGCITYDEFDERRGNLIYENTDVDSIATCLESESRLCFTGNDLRILAENIAQSRRERLTRKHLTKGQKAYLALRAIGKPAHCSEITEVYNALFPDEPSNEHNLHAVLSQEGYGVAWIGIRSTFALEEWGYEHPSTTLFDTAAEIVKERFEETGQPVPFTVVVAEMGKRRRVVNPSSLVIATQCNINLQRVGKDSFVPKKPTEEIQGETSAEELDRILRKFEKDSDKKATNQKLAPSSRKESPPSRFGRIILSLKQRLTSLCS